VTDSRYDRYESTILKYYGDIWHPYGDALVHNATNALMAVADEELSAVHAEVDQWQATFGRDALPGVLARVAKLEADRDAAVAAAVRECQTPGYTEGPCHCAYHDPEANEEGDEPPTNDMQFLLHSARDRVTNLTVDLAQAKDALDQARQAVEDTKPLTWAETIASTGSGDTALIEIDVNVPGHTEPEPVEIPLADARALYIQLGGILAEHDPSRDRRERHRDEVNRDSYRRHVRPCDGFCGMTVVECALRGRNDLYEDPICDNCLHSAHNGPCHRLMDNSGMCLCGVPAAPDYKLSLKAEMGLLVELQHFANKLDPRNRQDLLALIEMPPAMFVDSEED
jgi:hypothetical protein